MNNFKPRGYTEASGKDKWRNRNSFDANKEYGKQGPYKEAPKAYKEPTARFEEEAQLTAFDKERSKSTRQSNQTHPEKSPWIVYANESAPKIAPGRGGKWICFFERDEEEAANETAQAAVETGVVSEALVPRDCETGKYDSIACCLHIDAADLQAHRRVIQFMLENSLIKKSRTGSYYNNSFKFDKAGGRGGNDYHTPTIKLADFIDLRTGEFLVDENR